MTFEVARWLPSVRFVTGHSGGHTNYGTKTKNELTA